MPHWSEFWAKLVGLPETAPTWSVSIVAMLFIYTAVIFPTGLAMAFLERKISADLQARVGPRWVGFKGLLQPFADLMKLLQKKAGPASSSKTRMWWVLHTMALYSTLAVLPLGSLLVLVDTEMSVLIPFWAALVVSFGTMMLGVNEKTVPGWFGGFRATAQTLAGAFPALIAILCAGIHARGFQWSGMARFQSFSPLDWTAFSNPFQFIAFLIFICSGMVMLGVAPLDSATTSNSELQGGVASNLSGRKMSLYRLGRFYSVFLWTIIASVLFLGGWKLPNFLTDYLKENEYWIGLQLGELMVVWVKASLLMLGSVLIARVTPKIRVDQITEFAWNVMSPLSLIALVGAALWAGWVGQ